MTIELFLKNLLGLRKTKKNTCKGKLCVSLYPLLPSKALIYTLAKVNSLSLSISNGVVFQEVPLWLQSWKKTSRKAIPAAVKLLLLLGLSKNRFKKHIHNEFTRTHTHLAGEASQWRSVTHDSWLVSRHIVTCHGPTCHLVWPPWLLTSVGSFGTAQLHWRFDKCLIFKGHCSSSSAMPFLHAIHGYKGLAATQKPLLKQWGTTLWMGSWSWYTNRCRCFST